MERAGVNKLNKLKSNTKFIENFGKCVGEFLRNISTLRIKNQHKNVTDESHYMYWY